MTGAGVFTDRPSVALVAASGRVSRRPVLLVPVVLALVLVAGTFPVLDRGYALQVLRGAGVLLACAWAVTTDDASGEVLAASPYPRMVRTAARVLAGAVPVLPAWAAAALVVQWRAPVVPVLGVGLETLALGLTGLALGTTLRAWRDQHAPSHGAVVGLLALAFVTSSLPRWYAMQQSQTWGPPWEAAQLRWAALLLVGLGVAGLALRDPVARGDRPTPARRATGTRPAAATRPRAGTSTSR